jgi:hypothetical protein
LADNEEKQSNSGMVSEEISSPPPEVVSELDAKDAAMTGSAFEGMEVTPEMQKAAKTAFANREPEKPAHHVEWRHSDIVAMIPGMEAAFPDRNTLDVATAQQAIGDYISSVEAKMAAADMNGLVQAVAADPSPTSFKAFYDVMLPTGAEIQNIGNFIMVLDKYRGDGIPVEDVQALSGYMAQRAAVASSFSEALMPVLANLTPEQKQILLSSPEMADYQHTLRTTFSVGLRADVSDRTQQAEAMMQHNQQAQQSIMAASTADTSDNPNAGQAEFAGYINHAARGGVALARYQGMEDTFALSNYMLGIGENDIAAVNEAVGTATRAQGQVITPPPRVLRSMATIHDGSITFEEGLDIARSTLNRINPELGRVVDEAMAGGRVDVAEGMAPAAWTLMGNYDAETGKYGLPRMQSTFDGGLEGVWMLTHEMGHMANLTLSAEHNGANAYFPNVMVQEHFSHFTELAMRDELKERAKTDADKALVDAFFQNHLANSLSIQHAASFQNAVHQIVEKGDADLSYEQVQKIYRDTGTQTYGSKWKGKDSPMQDAVFMGNLSQTLSGGFMPHQGNAYLGNYVTAYALKELQNENPQAFGEKFAEAMRAGNRMSYAELMNHYFGEGEYEKGQLFERGMQAFATEKEAALDRIAAATRPDMTVGNLAKDLGALMKDLAIPRTSDYQGKENASSVLGAALMGTRNYPSDNDPSKRINELMDKYEPLVFRNPELRKSFRKVQGALSEFPAQRDKALVSAMNQLNDTVKELGTQAMEFTNTQPLVVQTMRMNLIQEEISKKADAMGRPDLLAGMMLVYAEDNPDSRVIGSAQGMMDKMTSLSERFPALAAKMDQDGLLQQFNQTSVDDYRALIDADPELQKLQAGLASSVDKIFEFAQERSDATKAGAAMGISAGGNAAGAGLGGLGLYQRHFGSDIFAKDWAAGGMQAALSTATTVADGTDLALSSAAAGSEYALSKAAGEAAEAAAKPIMESVAKLGSRAAIPIAIGAGTLEAGTGWAEKNPERVAGAVGGTTGGILGGIVTGAGAGAAAGAITGSPTGPFAIGTAVVGGLGGAILGAIYGEDAAKDMATGLVGDLMFTEEEKFAQKQFVKDMMRQVPTATNTVDYMHDDSLRDIGILSKKAKKMEAELQSSPNNTALTATLEAKRAELAKHSEAYIKNGGDVERLLNTFDTVERELKTEKKVEAPQMATALERAQQEVLKLGKGPLAVTTDEQAEAVLKAVEAKEQQSASAIKLDESEELVTPLAAAGKDNKPLSIT